MARPTPARRNRALVLGRHSVRMYLDLACAQPEISNPYWMLPYRGLIRAIEQRGERETLTELALAAHSTHARIIAVWLRGRCRGTRGAKRIAALYDLTDSRLNREIVRCLVRLSAWHELRMISEVEIDPTILRLARPPSRKSQEERIQSFCLSIQSAKVTPSRMSLYMLPGLRFDKWRGGKSRVQIREVLLRIQRILSGRDQSSATKR